MTVTLETVTERQLATLRLAMLGKSNKVIARDMDLSEATVKAHLSEAFRRLGVHNRTEAVFAVARSGRGAVPRIKAPKRPRSVPRPISPAEAIGLGVHPAPQDAAKARA